MTSYYFQDSSWLQFAAPRYVSNIPEGPEYEQSSTLYRCIDPGCLSLISTFQVRLAKTIFYLINHMTCYEVT